MHLIPELVSNQLSDIVTLRAKEGTVTKERDYTKGDYASSYNDASSLDGYLQQVVT